MNKKRKKLNTIKTRIPQGCQEEVNVISYYPWFLKLLMESHPEAAKIFTHKHREYCERTFGGKWELNKAQMRDLFRDFKEIKDAFDRDLAHHLSYCWIRDGFRIEDTEEEQGLQILSDLLKITHPVVKS